jgi:hypothetical protein
MVKIRLRLFVNASSLILFNKAIKNTTLLLKHVKYNIRIKDKLILKFN